LGKRTFVNAGNADGVGALRSYPASPATFGGLRRTADVEFPDAPQPRRRIRMDFDKPIRRIVTTHDASGKAVFLSDGPAQKVGQPGRPVNWPMWVLDTTPANCSGDEDFATKMKDIHT
jgi:hypothetical protein